jgi:membrane protein implicated in regulation of membrane protease activity
MILILAILLAVLLLEPPWSIVVIVVGCLLEVVEIFFLRRWSKRIDRKTKATTGSEAMIGQAGEVVEECQPVGTVRVNGELWSARCPEGAAKGDGVRVKGVDGLTLVVSPRRVRSA